MTSSRLSQGAQTGATGGCCESPRQRSDARVAAARGIPHGARLQSRPQPTSAFKLARADDRKFLGKLRDLSGGKPSGFQSCGHRTPTARIHVYGQAMLRTGIVPDFTSVDGSRRRQPGAAPLEFAQHHVGMPHGRGADLCAQYFARLPVSRSGELGQRGKVVSAFDISRALAGLGRGLVQIRPRGFLFAGDVAFKGAGVPHQSVPRGVRDPRIPNAGKPRWYVGRQKPACRAVPSRKYRLRALGENSRCSAVWKAPQFPARHE